VQMAFGRRAFFGWATAPDDSVWWFANPPRRHPAEAAEWTPASWRAELLELFAGDAVPAAELIRASDEIVGPWNTWDLPRVPVWRDDGGAGRLRAAAPRPGREGRRVRAAQRQHQDRRTGRRRLPGRPHAAGHAPALPQGRPAGLDHLASDRLIRSGRPSGSAPPTWCCGPASGWRPAGTAHMIRTVSCTPPTWPCTPPRRPAASSSAVTFGSCAYPLSFRCDQ
jgi:hypothetical protein